MTTPINTGVTPDPVEEFEQHLQELLNHPRTQPKYNLWQLVQYTSYDDKSYDNDNPEIKQGRVCGFHFVRVGIAFLQGRGEDPGWYYRIEADARIIEVYETDIVED
jgi:hypothetical protein